MASCRVSLLFVIRLSSEIRLSPHADRMSILLADGLDLVRCRHVQPA
jgi:hypothetical protein